MTYFCLLVCVVLHALPHHTVGKADARRTFQKTAPKLGLVQLALALLILQVFQPVLVGRFCVVGLVVFLLELFTTRATASPPLPYFGKFPSGLSPVDLLLPMRLLCEA